MAYEKQVWQSNELITTEKLNHMEDGIAAAKSSQTEVESPTTSGEATSFIDTISQDAQGVITPTKKTIPIVNNLTETTTGKLLDATQGKALNDSKLENNFSSFSVASTPYSGNEQIALYSGGTNYSTTVNELLSAAGGGGGTSQGALVNYTKNCGTISSSGDWPRTFEDTNITSDMVVLEAVLGNPAAQTGDWDVTTSNGSVTIGPKSGTSGGINGDTTLMLYFGVGMSTAPTLLTNLASTSAANILNTAPRPGVMGVLGLNNGGTGVNATDAVDLKSKLGIIATMDIIDNNTTSVIQAIKNKISTIPNVNSVCGKIDVDSYVGFYIGRKINDNKCMFHVIKMGDSSSYVVTRDNGTWSDSAIETITPTINSTYLTNSSEVSAVKCGKMVSVDLLLNTGAKIENTVVLITGLPIPAIPLTFVMKIGDGQTGRNLRVNAAGQITCFYNDIASGTHIWGSVTYIAQQTDC